MILDLIKQDRLEFRKSKQHVESDLLGIVIGQIDQTKDTSDTNVQKVIKSIMKSVDERIAKQYTTEDAQTAQLEKTCLTKYLDLLRPSNELTEELLQQWFDSIDKGAYMGQVKNLCKTNGVSFDGAISSKYFEKAH
jgi:hypothetical protein